MLANWVTHVSWHKNALFKGKNYYDILALFKGKKKFLFSLYLYNRREIVCIKILNENHKELIGFMTW